MASFRYLCIALLLCLCFSVHQCSKRHGDHDRDGDHDGDHDRDHDDDHEYRCKDDCDDDDHHGKRGGRGAVVGMFVLGGLAIMVAVLITVLCVVKRMKLAKARVQTDISQKYCVDKKQRGPPPYNPTAPGATLQPPPPYQPMPYPYTKEPVTPRKVYVPSDFVPQELLPPPPYEDAAKNHGKAQLPLVHGSVYP